MRGRLADLVFTALLAAAALCVAFLSTRFGWQRDFSYAQRSSLDARTVELLHRLDAPVSIVSYAGQEAPLRAAIEDVFTMNPPRRFSHGSAACVAVSTDRTFKSMTRA